MNQYPTIKVLDLVHTGEAKLQTGPFGTQLKASDYVSEGVPVINVRNVGFGDIRANKLEYLDEPMVEKLAAHKLKKGDIVFGRKGAVERHAFIGSVGDGWIQGSDCLRLRICSERINNRFISYYFITKSHQDWMQALCSFGATMASLNQDIVKLITLPLPSKDEQDKIAAILSAYDDLIENNKRRIALLENMAEEIYREWFVRFRFPGYQTTPFEKGIPKEWPIKEIGSLVKFDKGLSYKGAYLSDAGSVLVNLKCFSPGGGYRLEGEKYYSGSFSERHKVEEGDIILANTDLTQDGGIIGNPEVIPEGFHDNELLISHHLCAVRLGEAFSYAKYFFYHTLKTGSFKGHARGFANGATVLGLRTIEIERYKLLLPPDDMISSFITNVEPIHQMANKLKKENSTLDKTKNLLLPRLISGKLSVEDLDIQFPASMMNEAEAV